MADFGEVFKAVWDAEHSSNDRLVLHRNPKEKSYTFYGIYPYTKLPSSYKIKRLLREAGYPSNGVNLRGISQRIAKDQVVYQDVLAFYYEHFWRPLGLDYVENTHIAKELMVFGVNIGLKTDSRGINRLKYIVSSIQEILEIPVTGIMDSDTFIVLNSLEAQQVERFSTLFDSKEISFYRALVHKYKHLKIYLNGWIKRAKKV